MADGAVGRIALLRIARAGRHGGNGGSGRQCLDVGHDIGDGSLIGERRRHRRHHFSKHIVLVRTPNALLEIFQLPLQVPVALPGESRRMQQGIALSLHAMAGSAHGIERLAYHRISDYLSRGLCIRRMPAQPLLIRALFLHHNFAAHGEMGRATQLLAQDIEGTGAGRGKPDVGHHARHHIHLDPKLRHSEVVQHVLGAQQHLDRLADGEVHFLASHQDVVLPVGIFWIHAKRVFIADEACVNGAQHPVLAGEAIAPVPLLSDHLHDRGVLRNIDEFGPDHQTRRQHGNDAQCGQPDQPPFQLLVLGFVMGACADAAPEAVDRICHEQIDGDEDKAGDPEGDADRVIDSHPVGGDGCKPPRAQKVKRHRSHNQQNQHNCNSHIRSTPQSASESDATTISPKPTSQQFG